MHILIQGGRLIDPANGVDAVRDVYIAGGRIVGLGQAPRDFVPNRIIDARGLAVLPGLVDLSARLREPGLDHRGAPEPELQAALAGGVTSLVLPPDTQPVLDEPGLVDMLRHRAREPGQPRVYPLGAVTVGLRGQALTNMAELAEAGCVGFSQADAAIADIGVLLHAMQYAHTFGQALWLRAEDPWLARGGVAAGGAVASRLGLPGIPEQAETVALHTLFELQRATGARLHLCRLSTAAGLQLVRRAKAEGLPVTCDVAAHQVHLTDVDIGYFDTNHRLAPPLRGQRDRDAIRAALADGTIDAICSDHTPVGAADKLLPFEHAAPGATGLELLLSLALKWARDARLPVSAAVARVTSQPARVLGARALASCGQLDPGALADLCLVDLDDHWLVHPASLRSRGKHTPFLGMELPGKVRTTLVSGLVAYEAS